MTFADLLLLIRYVPRWLITRGQRITVLVGFGCLLIVGSHFWTDEGEREWMRDAGGAVIGISVARRWSAQGRRRVDPGTGRQVRNPTLRMTPEEAARIQRFLRPRK